MMGLTVLNVILLEDMSFLEWFAVIPWHGQSLMEMEGAQDALLDV